MHLILTGATGLVGTSALAHIIAASNSTSSPKVTRLSILARNSNIPYLQKHPLSPSSPLKLDVIQHNDFGSYSPQLLERLRGADGVIWALGISQNDVSSQDEYVRITKDFTLNAAEAFSTIPNKGAQNDGKLNFVFVSGDGVTQSPGRLTPLFGRVKGETEVALLEMTKKNSSLKVYNIRPGAVDPNNQPDVAEVMLPKWLNTFTKKAVYHVLFPPLRVVLKSRISPTEVLGAALTNLATGDGEPLTGKALENEGRTIGVTGIGQLVSPTK